MRITTIWCSSSAAEGRAPLWLRLLLVSCTGAVFFSSTDVFKLDLVLAVAEKRNKASFLPGSTTTSAPDAVSSQRQRVEVGATGAAGAFEQENTDEVDQEHDGKQVLNHADLHPRARGSVSHSLAMSSFLRTLEATQTEGATLGERTQQIRDWWNGNSATSATTNITTPDGRSAADSESDRRLEHADEVDDVERAEKEKLAMAALRNHDVDHGDDGIPDAKNEAASPHAPEVAKKTRWERIKEYGKKVGQFWLNWKTKTGNNLNLARTRLAMGVGRWMPTITRRDKWYRKTMPMVEQGRNLTQQLLQKSPEEWYELGEKLLIKMADWGRLRNRRKTSERTWTPERSIVEKTVEFTQYLTIAYKYLLDKLYRDGIVPELEKATRSQKGKKQTRLLQKRFALERVNKVVQQIAGTGKQLAHHRRVAFQAAMRIAVSLGQGKWFMDQMQVGGNAGAATWRTTQYHKLASGKRAIALKEGQTGVRLGAQIAHHTDEASSPELFTVKEIDRSPAAATGDLSRSTVLLRNEQTGSSLWARAGELFVEEHPSEEQTMMLPSWSEVGGLSFDDPSNWALITAVHPSSPAAQMGIREEDEIVAINGIEMNTTAHDAELVETELKLLRAASHHQNTSASTSTSLLAEAPADPGRHAQQAKEDAKKDVLSESAPFAGGDREKEQGARDGKSTAASLEAELEDMLADMDSNRTNREIMEHDTTKRLTTTTLKTSAVAAELQTSSQRVVSSVLDDAVVGSIVKAANGNQNRHRGYASEREWATSANLESVQLMYRRVSNENVDLLSTRQVFVSEHDEEPEDHDHSLSHRDLEQESVEYNEVDFTFSPASRKTIQESDASVAYVPTTTSPNAADTDHEQATFASLEHFQSSLNNPADIADLMIQENTKVYLKKLDTGVSDESGREASGRKINLRNIVSPGAVIGMDTYREMRTNRVLFPRADSFECVELEKQRPGKSGCGIFLAVNMKADEFGYVPFATKDNPEGRQIEFQLMNLENRTAMSSSLVVNTTTATSSSSQSIEAVDSGESSGTDVLLQTLLRIFQDRINRAASPASDQETTHQQGVDVLQGTATASGWTQEASQSWVPLGHAMRGIPRPMFLTLRPVVQEEVRLVALVVLPEEAPDLENADLDYQYAAPDETALTRSAHMLMQLTLGPDLITWSEPLRIDPATSQAQEVEPDHLTQKNSVEGAQLAALHSSGSPSEAPADGAAAPATDLVVWLQKSITEPVHLLVFAVLYFVGASVSFGKVFLMNTPLVPLRQALSSAKKNLHDKVVAARNWLRNK
ncbi:unnamed protein product [Amoebophrya sp. A120]|nr:unnamed protein product [Amoebophrya sp. A120]|eukprot:GSA120T00006363001.1